MKPAITVSNLEHEPAPATAMSVVGWNVVIGKVYQTVVFYGDLGIFINLDL